MKKLLLLLSSSHHQHQKQGYHYIITEYYTCNTISVSSQVENHICFFVPNYTIFSILSTLYNIYYLIQKSLLYILLRLKKYTLLLPKTNLAPISPPKKIILPLILPAQISYSYDTFTSTIVLQFWRTILFEGTILILLIF